MQARIALLQANFRSYLETPNNFLSMIESQKQKRSGAKQRAALCFSPINAALARHMSTHARRYDTSHCSKACCKAGIASR